MPNIPQDGLFNTNDISMEDKYAKYAEDLRTYSVFLDGQEKLLIAKEKRVDELIKKYMKERNLSEKKARDLALKAELQRQEDVYKKTSLYERDVYLKRRSYEVELLKKRLDDEEQVLLAGVKSTKKRKKIQDEFESMRQSYIQEQLKYEKELLKTQESIYRVKQKYVDIETRQQNAKKRLDDSKEELNDLKARRDILKEQYKDDLKNRAYLEEEAKIIGRIQEIESQLPKYRKEYYDTTQKKYRSTIQGIKEEREISEEVQQLLGKRAGLKGLKEASQSEVEMYGKILGEAISHYEATKKAYSSGEASADDLAAAKSSLIEAKTGLEDAESTDKIVKSVDSMSHQVVSNLIKINESINSEVEKALHTIKEYQPKVLARLQGTQKSTANQEDTLSTVLNFLTDPIKGLAKKLYNSYDNSRTQKTYLDILTTIRKNIAFSAFVSYEKTLENAVKLIDMGIAYNIEERAFLQTVSDNIVSTFDAFDSNLLRLIRLQQADTTAARMGMEAYVMKILNNMFSDTSYLNDVYDTVSAALIDAQSIMPYYEATSSEFVLQKWFGSLYALGFSDTTIQRIAKGINMLLTGDVQGLANDTAMQTLLAMSASRIETVDFANAMLQGLDSSQINDLMRSMVEYLQEIAKNSDTRVVRSAFNDIFDMSMSDLAAVQNLTASDIEDIYKKLMSYDVAYNEARSQLGELPSRLSLSDMIDNVIANMLFITGEEIAYNPLDYAIYTIASKIEQATGGISLPEIAIFGNEVDLSAYQIEDIIEEAVVFKNLVDTIIPGLRDSMKGGGGIRTSLLGSDWGATQFTSRGKQTLLNVSGTTTGVSLKSSNEQSQSDQNASKAMDIIQEIMSEESSIGVSMDTLNDTLTSIFNENATISDTVFGIKDLLTDIRDGTYSVGTLSVGTFASGTKNAPSGLAIVGENGPELVQLSGGESIFNSTETSNLISSLSTTSSAESYILNSVKISDIDANFENKLKQILNQVLADKSATTNSIFESSDGEDNFKELVRKMLDGRINVHVDNSYFDEFLQKNTYNF